MLTLMRLLAFPSDQGDERVLEAGRDDPQRGDLDARPGKRLAAVCSPACASVATAFSRSPKSWTSLRLPVAATPRLRDEFPRR